MVKAFSRLMLTLLLSVPALALAAPPSAQVADMIAERLKLWQTEGRNDRVEQLLAQLSRSNPRHPVLLETQAQLALQQGQTERFYALLATLEQVAPDALETARLREIANLSDGARQALATARLYTLAGRYEEAYAAYRSVFNEAPLNLDLAMDYWRSASQAGRHDEALAGFAALRERYPQSLAAELELYSAQLRANQLSASAAARVKSLIATPAVSANARQIWLRYIGTARPVQTEQIAELQAYLQSYPADLEAESLLRTLATERAQTQAYNAKPSTQAWQAAAAALDEGANEKALVEAKRAVALDAKDPQTHGMLGYAFMRNGQQRAAFEAFSSAQKLAPEANEWQQMVQESAFWAQLEQADADADAGRYADARAVYQATLAEQPVQEAALWGLYGVLEATLPTAEVDAWYASLTPAQRQILMAEFQRRRATQLASAAADETDSAASYALLQEAIALNPNDPWLTYQIAGRELELGKSEQAQQRFERLLASSADSEPSTVAETRYAYALWLSQAEQNQPALAQLQLIPAAQSTDNMQALQQRLEVAEALAAADLRDIINQWEQLDGYQAAQVLSAFSDNDITTDATAPTQAQIDAKLAQFPEDIDLLLAVSEYYTATGEAEAGYELALRTIALQWGASDDTNIASVWEQAANDDWRTARLRQQALSYTEANEAVLQIGFDYQNRDSTPGVSSLNAQTLLLELAVPHHDLFGLGAGEWFVKVDPTRIDAGTLDLTDEFVRERYGTGLLCDASCDLSPRAQQDQGVAIGVGIRTERWSADIGTSPLGFNESTLTGGLAYTSSWGELGWSVAAERRILSTSLLNFAGADDFRTGQTWGRVTQTGVNLSASWDQGGAIGWWGSAGYDWYRGINTADNARWYGYTGVYWRAFEREWLAIDVGLNALTWSFDADSSEATFGQGSYYSPQSYQSLSVPITFYGRWQRWSYSLRVAVGQSRTTDDDALFYPGHPQLQQQAVDIAPTTFVEPVFLGGSSSGFSRSINAAIEYRINAHWYVGFAANLQRAELFTPNNGMLYLRYHFGGYSLPPRRPPQPPVRYVDF